jgi:ABC-type polar amino acid transport system ATPase subunit
MNPLAVHFKGVSLHRGERAVLADVTFGVARGEVIALMGPSGSGKTTVLRLIAGLEPFQSGTIEVEGTPLSVGSAPDGATLRRLRRQVGMVFQFHHLFEHMTAAKNVWLAPVHAHGMPLVDAKERARELLARLGVEHRAAALPRELSGGEAQRVAIARALAVNPPLLLMDEPTASLDSGRRTELRDLLLGLCGEGRTLIIATHDEDFARSCATRFLRMVDGKVIEDPGGRTAGMI